MHTVTTKQVNIAQTPLHLTDLQEPQPPTFGTKRQLQSHCTEPLLFELEMLRVTPA